MEAEAGKVNAMAGGRTDPPLGNQRQLAAVSWSCDPRSLTFGIGLVHSLSLTTPRRQLEDGVPQVRGSGRHCSQLTLGLCSGRCQGKFAEIERIWR